MSLRLCDIRDRLFNFPECIYEIASGFYFNCGASLDVGLGLAKVV